MKEPSHASNLMSRDGEPLTSPLLVPLVWSPEKPRQARAGDQRPRWRARYGAGRWACRHSLSEAKRCHHLGLVVIAGSVPLLSAPWCSSDGGGQVMKAVIASGGRHRVRNGETSRSQSIRLTHLVDSGCLMSHRRLISTANSACQLENSR